MHLFTSAQPRTLIHHTSRMKHYPWSVEFSISRDCNRIYLFNNKAADPPAFKIQPSEGIDPSSCFHLYGDIRLQHHVSCPWLFLRTYAPVLPSTKTLSLASYNIFHPSHTQPSLSSRHTSLPSSRCTSPTGSRLPS